MKYLSIIGCLLVTVMSSCQADKDPTTKPVENLQQSLVYTVSNDVFTNPERGFVHTWQVFSEGTPLNETTLAYLKNEHISTVWRLYYLEKFKTTDLSDAQLNLIKTDFERLRKVGLKCVLRFAYTDAIDGTDAPFSTIEAHLNQLKPILVENADVIAFVQAGFIGAWGEWHSSSNGLATTANKKLVLNKLLEIFPKEIKIQIRTPLAKQEIFEYSTAIGTDVGYGNTNIARVGFHNDCFLASVDDYGTYQNVAKEKEYISNEATYVPTGGETCPPDGVSLASCTKAEDEMALLKWTYLNLDYYGPVLNEWRNGNCFGSFEKKLGYRLSLQSSSLIPEAALNSNIELSATVNNVGFAPVYNTKNTYLIFRSVQNGTLYMKKLNFDVRKVIPKVSYLLKESVSLSDIPAGKYDLLLKIEDYSTKLKDRPEYCIRLANAGVWEETTGFNKLLQSITIK